MAGGSNGYRAALVRCQLTPGLISSLPGTAVLPPFISFSTSCHENILTRSFCCRRQRRNDRDGGLGQLELGSVGSEPNIAGPEYDPGHSRRQGSRSHDSLSLLTRRQLCSPKADKQQTWRSSALCQNLKRLVPTALRAVSLQADDGAERLDRTSLAQWSPTSAVAVAANHQ
jgi:hypothetical protein